MNLADFHERTRRGAIRYAWVDMNDSRECPDCYAIMAQQPVEGLTMDEWIASGAPGAGHTVCNDACRCGLVPIFYANVSDELDPGDIGTMVLSKKKQSPQITRLSTMLNKLRDRGVVIATLGLLGLSFAEQENAARRELARQGFTEEEIAELLGVSI